MAQNGLPNKVRLCAANGLSPTVMLGNSVVENSVFGDIFSSWQPMKTSYTASSDDSNNVGRPTTSDGDLSKSFATISIFLNSFLSITSSFLKESIKKAY